MKKTLLLTTVAIISVIGIQAQTVWNFSNAPFGASATVTFSSTFTTTDGLTVGTNGTVLFSLTANNKTIDGTAYTYRLQTGGGGVNVAPSFIPTTRYLSFNVSGGSTINIGMISSNSSSVRTLMIVNSDQSVVDSIPNVIGSSALTYTYTYTGAASKLYLYSRSSGINFYYLSATNVVTSVRTILASKGVSFDGTEIINSKSLPIEVYNVLGKRVVSANTTISTKNFQRGIYIVRVAGTNDALKIII